MKGARVGKSMSGLRWAGRTCRVTERKVADTIWETLLLSTSLLLVLLRFMNTAPSASDAKAQRPAEGPKKGAANADWPVRRNRPETMKESLC
jgi:hypothetical protein